MLKVPNQAEPPTSPPPRSQAHYGGGRMAPIVPLSLPAPADHKDFGENWPVLPGENSSPSPAGSLVPEPIPARGHQPPEHWEFCEVPPAYHCHHPGEPSSSPKSLWVTASFGVPRASQGHVLARPTLQTTITQDVPPPPLLWPIGMSWVPKPSPFPCRWHVTVKS